MARYSLRTIRNKAYEAGYKVSKGFLVWDCYDSNYDHLWTLEDVEEFIKSEYDKAKIAY